MVILISNRDFRCLLIRLSLLATQLLLQSQRQRHKVSVKSVKILMAAEKYTFFCVWFIYFFCVAYGKCGKKKKKHFNESKTVQFHNCSKYPFSPFIFVWYLERLFSDWTKNVSSKYPPIQVQNPRRSPSQLLWHFKRGPLDFTQMEHSWG